MPSKAVTIIYNGFVSHYFKNKQKNPKTEVQFIYNIVSVSGVQQGDSYLSCSCLVAKSCPSLL